MRSPNITQQTRLLKLAGALSVAAALAAGCSHAPQPAPGPASPAAQRAIGETYRQKDVQRLQNMETQIQNNPRVPADIKAKTVAGLSNQIQADQREGGQ